MLSRNSFKHWTGTALLLMVAVLGASEASAQQTFEYRLEQARNQLFISADRALESARELRREAESANNPFRTLDAIDLEVAALADVGRGDEAFALAEQALARAEQLDEPVRQSKPLRRMASIHIDRNEYPEAEAKLDRALALLELAQAPRELARTLSSKARVRRYQVRYSEALDYANQAMQIFSDIEDFRGIADITAFRGVVLEKVGQFESALAAFNEALPILRRLDDLTGVASALFNIAEIHRELEDYELALDYFEQTLELDQRSGNKLNIAYSHNMLGRTQMDLERYADARETFEKDEQHYREIDAKRDVAWAQTMLGRAQLLLGERGLARETLEAALATGIERQAHSLVPFTRRVLVELELAQGNPSAALAQAEQGLILSREIEERDQEQELLGYLADAREAAGDLPGTIEALRERLEVRESIFKENRAEAFAVMQGQAEFERRAQQIELLEKDRALAAVELQKQRTQRNAWIVGVSAGFAILLMLTVYLQQRRLNRSLSRRVGERTRELEVANRDLEAAYQAVEKASETDELTGLMNRRFLGNHIHQEVRATLDAYSAAKDEDGEIASDLTFMLIDFDDFKGVNDEFGHPAGDEVLRQMRGVLTSVFGDDDFLVRWGGEEFLAVIRGVPRGDVSALAERVRLAVAQFPFALANGETIHKTCSIGFASFPFDATAPTALDWKETIDVADRGLYAAKASGRNAWVGLASTGHTSPEATLKALREDPAKATRERLIRLISSLSPSQVISWS